MAAIIKTDQVLLDQTTSSAVGAPALILKILQARLKNRD
jgi:hypothetical protein